MTSKKPDITLRQISDLEFLFQFQLDREGGYLAAFMPKDVTDKSAYLTKHRKLLDDQTVNNQTIILANTIVGSIAKFVMQGNTEITYWIDRNYWGQGIATKALKELLSIETTRPFSHALHLTILADKKYWKNVGLSKSDQTKVLQMHDKTEIEEFIYKLS